MPISHRPQSGTPVVLITGATGGIGLATAHRFAQGSWSVVGTGRRIDASTAKLPFDLQRAEMARPADIERVVSYVERVYGRLDILICNAGYGLTGPLEALDYAQMRDLLLVNTLAPAEMTRRALPLLQGSRGTVLFVSSVAGRTGLPLYSAYAASKWGLEGFAESLALELEPKGVRVRIVEPSGVNTPFWRQLVRGSASRWREADHGRIGAEAGRREHGLTPEQVAEALWQAGVKPGRKLRIPLGDTGRVVLARRWLPERVYVSVLGRLMQ